MSEDLLEQLRRSIATRSEPSDELMVKAADSIEKLEEELEAVYAERNFYKLLSESLEATVNRLEMEKTLGETQRGDFIDRNIALNAENDELKSQISALKYQGQDK